MTKLRLHFSKEQDSIHFDFLLHDNPFVRKWTRVLKNTLDKGSCILSGGTFYGSSLYTGQEIIATMEESLRIINTRSAERITLVPYPDMNQDFLNALHKEFERVSAIPAYWPGKGYDDVNQALIDLNSAIHQYETFATNSSISGKESPYFSFDVNFDLLKKMDLAEEDFQYFTPDVVYGGVYLNYATVGVPVLNAFWNKETQLPVPQRQYKADFRVCFDNDKKFSEYEPLKKWVAEVYGWDPENPKLALGYIPLGQVVIDGRSKSEIMHLVRAHRFISGVEIL